MIMIIQLISQQILAKCNRIHDPYELWTHLKSQYYSDSPYSFVHQMHSLFTIGSSFDSSQHGFPCEGHLWFQCRRLKEEQAKRKKKEKDQKDQKGKGKADKNIKPESAHVSMEVGQSSSQFEPLSGQQQSSSQFEPLSGQQKLSVGSNQPSAGTDQPSAGTDVALTAVSTHHKHENDWIFDTAASSHMTSDLGRFETFSANSGTIEVAGETFLEYKGKGSCLVYPLYPDGTTSVVRLINVLYVPTLGYNLISWNVLRNRFLCLMGGNHVYVKDTRDASQPLVLHGLFRSNLPFLVESKPNAFYTGLKPAFYTGSKPAFYTGLK